MSVADSGRNKPSSPVYDDAIATFRHTGDEELIGMTEGFRYAKLAPLDGTDDFLSGERLRAAQDELARRARIRRRHPDLPDPDLIYADRLALAREVREQADIIDTLNAALGFKVEPANRAGTEWAGPCPVCGGCDRFRVWVGPPGRFWCRQCAWSGDVITLTRNLIPGCSAFGGAVERLAEALGIVP